MNRGILIVRPKKPFVDWTAGLDDSGIVPSVEGEHTVYLIPSFENDAEAEAILAKIHGKVFENELFGWHTDKSAWPENRTLTMFKQWFEIELHSEVEDLCDYKIVDEDDA